MKREPAAPNSYTRVTQILKPFSNFDHIDTTTLHNAADRGTRVHAYCESHALGLFVTDVDEDCKNYFECYQRWFDAMVQKVLHVEIPVASEKYRFCTHGIDLIAFLKGDDYPSIIDLKTPLSPSLTWQLQTAAYQILAEKTLEIPIKRRICLMLPKFKDDVKVIEYPDDAGDRDKFLKALELYRFFNG